MDRVYYNMLIYKHIFIADTERKARPGTGRAYLTVNILIDIKGIWHDGLQALHVVDHFDLFV